MENTLMRSNPTKNETIARTMYKKFNIFLIFTRFLKHVTIGKEDDCWEWKGYVAKGYGRFEWPEKHIHEAHVASYELFVGRRHGKYVCHSCDNPCCVNPNHLWLGTHKQNMYDMIHKKRHNFFGYGVGHVGERFRINARDARKIVKLYRLKRFTQKELADKYNISQHLVSDLVLDKTRIQ